MFGYECNQLSANVLQLEWLRHILVAVVISVPAVARPWATESDRGHRFGYRHSAGLKGKQLNREMAVLKIGQ